MDTESVVNGEVTQAMAIRLGDPWVSGDTFPLPETWDLAAFDECCHKARNHVPDGPEADEALGRVLDAFLALAPTLGLLPSQGSLEPHQVEYHFARIRVWCFGFGHALHARAARALARLHPASPLDETETWDQWSDAAQDARRMCGLPLGIAALSWQDLCLLPMVDGSTEDTTYCGWLLPLAALHLLRHVRRSPRHERLVATYQSSALSIELAGTSGLTVSKTDVPIIQRALRVPAKKGKLAHPLGQAVASVLGTLPRSALLQRRPLRDLPGHLLVGPAAGLVPDPCAQDQQIAHGLALDGVRVAVEGRIYDARDCDLDASDIVDWDWQVDDVSDAQRQDAAAWIANLPDTYDVSATPSQIVEQHFPHTVWAADAHKALFDAVFAAHVLRAQWPALRREFPILFVLPDISSPENSKNMGKSLLAENLLEALAPQAEYLRAPSGEQAPDMRAIDTSVRRGGTVGLDEWNVWPSGTNHPMNQDNLCGLAEGRKRLSGRVLENDPDPVIFHAPLVVQAKTCPLRQDVLLRILPLWLRETTAEERQRGEAIASVKTKRMAVLLRLAAVATAARFNVEELAAANPPSPGDWKFDRHWYVATLLHAQAAGCNLEKAEADLRACAQAISYKLREGQEMAETSGLQSDLDTGKAGYYRANIMWEDMSDVEMMRWWTAIKHVTAGREHGATPLELLRAWCDSCNAPFCDLSLLLQRKAGRGRFMFDASPSVLSRRFRSWLDERLHEHGSQIMLPGLPGENGWKLVRDDATKTTRFGLVNEIPTHPVNTRATKAQ